MEHNTEKDWETREGRMRFDGSGGKGHQGRLSAILVDRDRGLG